MARNGNSIVHWVGLTLLGVGLSCAPVAGQSTNLGIRAGLTLGGVRYEDAATSNQMEIRSGLHLGVASRSRLRSHVDLGASIIVSQEGFHGTGAFNGDIRTVQLAAPILLEFHLPTEISPRLGAGLSARYQIHCSLSHVPLVGNARCGDPVVGTDWKAFDVAAVLGLGIDLPIRSRIFATEAQFALGLRDVNSDPLPPGWAKNASIRISFIVFLRPGGEPQ